MPRTMNRADMPTRMAAPATPTTTRRERQPCPGIVFTTSPAAKRFRRRFVLRPDRGVEEHDVLLAAEKLPLPKRLQRGPGSAAFWGAVDACLARHVQLRGLNLGVADRDRRPAAVPDRL